MLNIKQALPSCLYTAAQVREMDQMAISECGVTGFELMSRAGRSLFRQLLKCAPQTKMLSIFCGGGNNGGDGYIVAALAKARGLEVEIFCLAPVVALKGDAKKACQWAKELQIEIHEWSDTSTIHGDIIVDAMLGTGLSGEVRSPYLDAIRQINESDRFVVAADVPSGLCSDTGRVFGLAVRANLTVSFIGVKQGLLTGQGPHCSGDIHFDDLGVSADIVMRLRSSSTRIDFPQMSPLIPRRNPCDHKGVFGRVLLVGGNSGMGGAILLASEAAMRSGAGLVSVITRTEHVQPLLTRTPEVMVAAYSSDNDLRQRVALASVVVLGPGLGKDAWARNIYSVVMDEATIRNVPVICDADALNILAEGVSLDQAIQRDLRVITPHSGEAAKLLQTTVDEIEKDRFAALNELQRRYGGAVVLKGAGTLIKGGGALFLANVGNPGMAAGGMGDVLSGIIGALVAQGLSLEKASCLGVCWHGESADVMVQDKGMIGLSATDVINGLVKVVVPYEARSQASLSIAATLEKHG